MITTYVEGDAPIRLGHVRDNEAYRVAFPVSNTLKLFGEGGTWNILYKRPTETVAYPVPTEQIECDGEFLYWTIKATETAFPGKGECQLAYIVGDTVKMSFKWCVGVCASLISGGNAPSYIEIWLNDLKEYKDNAEAAAESAEDASEAIQNMGVLANTLPSTASASVEKIVDPETGAVTLKFGIPKGAEGGMSIVIVAELPEEGEPNTIYLVPTDDPSTGNLYDEYIYANGHWELVGGMSVDLSNYLTKTEAESTYVPKETDGEQIRIDTGNASLNLEMGATLSSADSVDISGSYGVQIISDSSDIELNTSEGAVTYNGEEIAVKSDLPTPPTKSTLTIATTDWEALADSEPYTYSATESLTIADGSTIELINDNAVLFATHGFAIGGATTTAVTIYSVGVPSASISLKVEVSK